MKPSDFFTRAASNEGAQMPILDPLTGKPSGEFMLVRGFDSTAFQDALVVKSRRTAEILTMPEAEQAAARAQAEDCLFLALVGGWSFEEEFTEDAVLELLHEAPSIRQDVDTFASKRANFIKRQPVS